MVDFIGIDNVAVLPEASHTDIGVNSFPIVKLKRINFKFNQTKSAFDLQRSHFVSFLNF